MTMRYDPLKLTEDEKKILAEYFPTGSYIYKRYDNGCLGIKTPKDCDDIKVDAALYYDGQSRVSGKERMRAMRAREARAKADLQAKISAKSKFYSG